jgi:hypothetical protein
MVISSKWWLHKRVMAAQCQGDGNTVMVTEAHYLKKNLILQKM